MEKLQISTQLVNAMLAYLGTKPFQEVFQLISAIQAEANNQAKPEAPAAEPVPAPAEEPNV